MLNKLAEEIRQINAKHGFDCENIPEKLCLMHSEISEALEEYRNDACPTVIYYKDGKPEGMPFELADCIIRILDFCAFWNIDIEAAIQEKLEYNKTRPYKHGRTC